MDEGKSSTCKTRAIELSLYIVVKYTEGTLYKITLDPNRLAADYDSNLRQWELVFDSDDELNRWFQAIKASAPSCS